MVGRAEISDRTGRDVLCSISAIDGKFYATDPKTVDNATAADMDDWLDFTVPSVEADKVVLVFRLRNSLLTRNTAVRRHARARRGART